MNYFPKWQCPSFGEPGRSIITECPYENHVHSFQPLTLTFGSAASATKFCPEDDRSNVCLGQGTNRRHSSPFGEHVSHTCDVRGEQATDLDKSMLKDGIPTFVLIATDWCFLLNVLSTVSTLKWVGSETALTSWCKSHNSHHYYRCQTVTLSNSPLGCQHRLQSKLLKQIVPEFSVTHLSPSLVVTQVSRKSIGSSVIRRVRETAGSGIQML